MVLFLFAAGCASRVAPTGGEKDILPPKFVSATPENSSVNFTGKEISINFNENLQLKDLPTQLLISPIMDPRPEVKVSKKSVIIKLPEKLRENTTYSINFGKAIADLNEGNVFENYQYVFSTGPILDSLKCIGYVKDAATLSALKDITVMLYLKSDSTATPDSLVYKKNPDYFTHTTESGFFEINNIASGDYIIYALEDKNNNYLLDNVKEERMAFTNKLCVIPQQDSIDLKLSIQKPAQSQYLNAVISDRYRATLIFNQHIDSLTVSELYSSKIFSGKTEWTKEKDSLYIFMQDTIADSLNLFIQSEPSIHDTVQLQMRGPSISKRKISNNKFRIELINSPEHLGPSSKFILESSRPLATISSNIKLYADSILITPENYSLKRDTTSQRNLIFDYKWKEGVSYKAIILPGNLTDIYGISNDSLNFHFKVPTIESVSSVNIKLTNVIEGQSYLLQLLNSKFEIVKQQQLHSSGKYDFNFIAPGIYIFRVVSDINKNFKWDSANYLIGKQPEEIFITSSMQLRANWDLELEINCNSKQK